MSASEVCLHHLIGRKVFDADGEKVGRLEDMRVEIELLPDGNDYVVVEYHVGVYGALEALAGGRFAQHVLQRLGRLTRYRRHVIPWSWMDVSDPERPTVTRRRSELPTQSAIATST
jgi:hypothetical protein